MLRVLDVRFGFQGFRVWVVSCRVCRFRVTGLGFWVYRAGLGFVSIRD